ncbi:MAG: pullulanase-type alpha-1,6-glucosidase [Ardenticatenaceae bacterium]|nr:pullulanase-type alpha-1,6-glucosidase [Ardenticatenaceae bacterium]
MLAYDPANDLYLATFNLNAGSYEYKAALNGSWQDNYGLNAEYYGPNILLTVPEAGPVTFFYDHKTRWVSDSINSLIATVPGSYQPTVGCSGEWLPDCLRSLLQDPDGDGIYTFTTALIPAGDYEAKVAINQSWDENYGADGVANGGNIPFTIPERAQTTFTYDPASHVLTISTADAPPEAITTLADLPTPGNAPLISPLIPQPSLVVIPGTIQSVLGCEGDWLPDCEATALAFNETNQLWQNTFILPAGSYEYKAAINGSWDTNFGLNGQRGGPNIPLNLAEETAVTFYFDRFTGWVTDDVNSILANIVGSFQDEIGCANDFAPDCLRTWLQDPDGDGIFIYQTVDIPLGEYEAKVAVNQSLDENYGAEGELDGDNIPFSVPEEDILVAFAWDSNSKLLSVGVGAGGRPVIPGNIKLAAAHWVTADTIAWDVDTELPNLYQLHYGEGLALTPDGVTGGETVTLTLDEAGLSGDVLVKFPHLEGFQALKIGAEDLPLVPDMLRGQTAVSARDDIGPLDATALQIPGVLDDLYTYDGELGVTFAEGVPTLHLWAPTAWSVQLYLYADSSPETTTEAVPMAYDETTGVWSVTGDGGWNGRYYLYEVTVYAPTAGAIVTNLVTDPYAVSLALNSTRSQIVDLNDPAYKPEGWDELQKPPLAAPEDIVVYEIHMRDFSVNDPTVPAEHRGTYLAFTDTDSNGMTHLDNLAAAGLTHLHLLPTFDITTINENKAEWVEPDPAAMDSFPPDSEEQQALLSAIRDQDGFNWGYDPYHYTVPEGSYATNPDGPARIGEYRQMVQSLSNIGLRVVADVVYNHTSSSGQADTAVLDRIVPGYYHRLNAIGSVENSTCCQNTATEHNMMRKLMVDSVVTWAVQYKVDAFRFDLMGHHMVADMQAVREALDALTLEADGVDGKAIYVYGEGWNFGEVADNARGVNATQFNMAGTGIGTFNDRLRDAVRGGTPFGGHIEQGFSNGLYYAPNEFDQGTAETQLARLLLLSDHIRAGLAGNLRNYRLLAYNGRTVPASNIDYNGSPTAYTADPQENIVYISKHDNETLWDVMQYKAPAAATVDERVRMQNMGLSLVALSQGVPFFQAGSDMLRSKSLDRNSYNSGDWFNKLDFSYETNNWGVGLPPSGDNASNWPLMQPLLARTDLAPNREQIGRAVAHFQEMLQIRKSSPLFRLQTADQVSDRLVFHNTGPFQIPGLIVMSLSDIGGENLDPNYGLIVVLFNANNAEQQFTEELFTDLPLALHPVQVASSDGVVQTAVFDPTAATFTVPGRTTAVFVLPEADTPAELIAPEKPAPTREPTVEPTPAPTAGPTPQPTAEPGEEIVATATAVAPLTNAPAETAEPETGGSGWLWIVGGGVLLAGIAGYFFTRRRS